MVLIHKKGRFSGCCSLGMVLIHKKGRFSGCRSLGMGVWVEGRRVRFVEVVCSGEMLVVFFNCSSVFERSVSKTKSRTTFVIRLLVGSPPAASCSLTAFQRHPLSMFIVFLPYGSKYDHKIMQNHLQ